MNTLRQKAGRYAQHQALNNRKLSQFTAGWQIEQAKIDPNNQYPAHGFQGFFPRVPSFQRFGTMTNEARAFPKTLEPLADLLAAHARLVHNTSEKMAVELGDAVRDLLASLADSSVSSDLQKDASRLLSALQTQDILRQQIEVLSSGLQFVADAQVPEGQNPHDWHSDRLEKMKKSYVMPAQFDVHSQTFGQAEEPKSGDDGMVFF